MSLIVKIALAVRVLGVFGITRPSNGPVKIMNSLELERNSEIPAKLDVILDSLQDAEELRGVKWDSDLPSLRQLLAHRLQDNKGLLKLVEKQHKKEREMLNPAGRPKYGLIRLCSN